MIWDRDIEERELEERLIFALLRPVASMAIRAKLPVRQLNRLVKLTYFQELRSRGMTLQEIADAMDTSLPTVARLSKELKFNFLRPEHEHQLPQRIEFMLWAAPLSRARLKQSLGEFDSKEVDEALEQMVQEGQIAWMDKDRDVFGLEAPRVRLMKDSWPSRLGSLGSMLRNLSDTVTSRFFDSPAQAFARSINFRIPEDQLDRLHALYEEVIWSVLVQMDESARLADKVRQVRLSLFWHAQAPEEKPRDTV